MDALPQTWSLPSKGAIHRESWHLKVRRGTLRSSPLANEGITTSPLLPASPAKKAQTTTQEPPGPSGQLGLPQRLSLQWRGVVHLGLLCTQQVGAQAAGGHQQHLSQSQDVPKAPAQSSAWDCPRLRIYLGSDCGSPDEGGAF